MKLLASDQPVLAVIGPSGAGKSTIIQQLVDSGLLDLTPTWTDRPQRPGEEVLEHRFVTSREFSKLADKQFFAHPPITLFNLPYRYALPKLPVPPPGKVPALMARIMALRLLDQFYPNRVIYQIEAPYDLVAGRLKQRSETGVELGSRLADYKDETERGRQHAARVFINGGSLESVTKQIETALRQDFDIARPSWLPYTHKQL